MLNRISLELNNMCKIGWSIKLDDTTSAIAYKFEYRPKTEGHGKQKNAKGQIR